MEKLATKISCLSSSTQALAENSRNDTFLNIHFQLNYLYDEIHNKLDESNTFNKSTKS